MTPANGATGQVFNTSVALLLNVPVLNPSQIATLAKLNPNVTGPSVTLMAGNTVIEGAAAFAGDGLHLTFTPAANLPITTTFTLTVTGLRSLAGVPMSASFISTFTTSNQRDTTPPAVVRYSPSYGMTNVPVNSNFSVEFSKQIDTTTLNTTSIYMSDYVIGKIAGRVVADSTGRIATFVPATPLPVGRQINVSIGSEAFIRDLAGNILPSAFLTFYTGFASDVIPPAIIGNNPQNGDKGNHHQHSGDDPVQQADQPDHRRPWRESELQRFPRRRLLQLPE